MKHCIYLLVITFAFFSSCYSIPTDMEDDSLDNEPVCKTTEHVFPSNLENPCFTDTEDVIVYYGFTSSYNHSTLVPNWVAWELTAEEVEGELSFKPSFSLDPNLEGRQASREDYSNSGWDKGHMAPRADMKWSELSLVESYYFTNICPQNHNMNAYDWCTVEKLCRKMALKHGVVFVVCGPIFTTNEYGTIGDNKVMVPDYFFKAMLVPSGDSYESIAFVMQNSEERHSLCEYAMTVDSLESILGRDLFMNLDNEVESIVESIVDFGFWGISAISSNE